jgi:hypothetical protein
MALQVDDDWKRQAQEEKRRLAEEAKAREAQAAAKPAAAPAASSPASGAPEGRRRRRELPDPSFSGLVQSMLTQAHYALGEYAGPDGEPAVDLDAARYQLGLLDVLEARTKGNLSVDESRLLDSALYELRSRYVSVATAMIR